MLFLLVDMEVSGFKLNFLSTKQIMKINKYKVHMRLLIRNPSFKKLKICK